MFEKFCKKLNSDKPFFTVEITPPHGASMNGIIEKIKNSKIADKIDGFSVTDNPLAQLKMSSILSAIKVQKTFSKPVITTFSMRDRNKLSLQSSLLGANDFDIKADEYISFKTRSKNDSCFNNSRFFYIRSRGVFYSKKNGAGKI